MFAEDNYNYKAVNDKNITVDNIGNISAVHMTRKSYYNAVQIDTF